MFEEYIIPFCCFAAILFVGIFVWGFRSEKKWKREEKRKELGMGGKQNPGGTE